MRVYDENTPVTDFAIPTISGLDGSNQEGSYSVSNNRVMDFIKFCQLQEPKIKPIFVLKPWDDMAFTILQKSTTTGCHNGITNNNPNSTFVSSYFTRTRPPHFDKLPKT